MYRLTSEVVREIFANSFGKTCVRQPEYIIGPRRIGRHFQAPPVEETGVTARRIAFTKQRACAILGKPDFTNFDSLTHDMEWRGDDAKVVWKEGDLSLETYIGGDEGGWMPLHTEAQAKAALVVIGRQE